ncbi:hypothetical protein MXD62_07535 [Frankia sp. Mgl5]|nr:hypothetical protein [Frankia sp. Mgl5]MCK9927018.1 hypothetical protein [Frankia sp. Mgl5]
MAMLSTAERDRLLLRVVQDEAAAVRMEMLRRFHDETAPSVAADPPRRTVAELLDGMAHRRAERQSRQVAERAEEESRRERARALAYERRLDELAHDEEATWAHVEALIAERKPAGYAAAVTLLTDLRILAQRSFRLDEFALRCAALRQDHARKPSLLDRLNRADL